MPTTVKKHQTLIWSNKSFKIVVFIGCYWANFKNWNLWENVSKLFDGYTFKKHSKYPTWLCLYHIFWIHRYIYFSRWSLQIPIQQAPNANLIQQDFKELFFIEFYCTNFKHWNFCEHVWTFFCWKSPSNAQTLLCLMMFLSHFLVAWLQTFSSLKFANVNSKSIKYWFDPINSWKQLIFLTF